MIEKLPILETGELCATVPHPTNPAVRIARWKRSQTATEVNTTIIFDGYQVTVNQKGFVSLIRDKDAEEKDRSIKALLNDVHDVLSKPEPSPRLLSQLLKKCKALLGIGEGSKQTAKVSAQELKERWRSGPLKKG